jgi:hypothetical protein
LSRPTAFSDKTFDPAFSFIVRDNHKMGRWERRHIKNDAIYMVVSKLITVRDQSSVGAAHGR